MNKITKNIAALIAFGIGTTTISFAQVTQQKIGNNPTLINPNAALEVESTTKGLLLPRLGLSATNNFAPLLAHVAGMTVYNTATAGTAPNNVTPGYYYNDGTQWVRIATGADAKTEPWRQQTTTNEATANSQSIYQTGGVAVGDFSGAASTKKMEVKGDFRSETTVGGNLTGLEVNSSLPGNPTGAYWINPATGQAHTLLTDAASARAVAVDNMNAPANISNFEVSVNSVNMYSKHGGEAKQSTLQLNGNDGRFALYANKAVDNWGAKIETDQTSGANGLYLYHAGSTGLVPVNHNDRTQITIKKAEGVTFSYHNSGGSTTPVGTYTFPKTSGTNGQVMTKSTGNDIIWATPVTPAAITADNGLTRNVNAVELGGTLNKTTTIATVNGAVTHPLNISGLPTGAITDNIVLSSGVSGQLKTIPASTFAATNIYTNDGTLAGNRTVTTSSNFLRFTGNGNIVAIDNSGTQGRLNTVGSVRGSLGMTGGSGATVSTMELYTDAGNLAQINASGAGSTGLSMGTTTATPLTFKTNGVNRMTVTPTGDVAIGSATAPSFTVGATTIQPKLYVAGDISTTGKVWTTNSVYADYVFEKYFKGSSDINPNYEFKSLNYVKDFIKANNHLPGVESITDLAKAENGYTFDITKLTVQSLEKIEELYLHTIEQQEKIDAQQAEINQLKKQTAETNERLERLEQLLKK